MKKILTLLAAATLLLLPSCRFIRVSDDLMESLKDGLRENGKTIVVDEDGETVTASENLATEARETGAYDAIQCNIPCNMTYTPGDFALSITAPDNIMPHIQVFNEGSRLLIKSDGANFRNVKNINIRFSSNELKEVTFNGAVDFDAPKGISAGDFALTVNGAGDIEIDGLKTGDASIIVNGAGDVDVSGIACKRLSVELNGAGNAVVSGNADRADLQISGAGSINAVELRAGEHTSKVRGIGKIKTPKND